MQAYERIFNQQANIETLRCEAREMRKAAQAYYTLLFEAAQKAAKKAAGKQRMKGTMTLPEDVIEGLRQQTFAKYPRVETIGEEIKKAKDTRESLLNDLAPKTKLKPLGAEVRSIKESSFYAFSSQTAPVTYTLAFLKPLAWKLDSLGFCHEVRPTSGEYSSPGYTLWSNAQLWQADCADRLITVKESLNAMGRCVNPMVVFSNFFPYALADEHYAKSGPGFTLVMQAATPPSVL